MTGTRRAPRREEMESLGAMLELEASQANVRAFIGFLPVRVEDRFGVAPEPEVQLAGRFDLASR